METGRHFISLVSGFFLIVSHSASILPTSPLLGIPPQEEKNFASEVIKCKDGTKSFTRARLNDGFCDCSDGTDEPGTSACPEGKFYCRNVGSKPQLLFSSRVNDLLCDCCDGSDEYDGSIHCPNTCFKDGNVLNNNDNHNSTKTDMGTIHAKETNSRVNLEDLIQKLKGLKMVVILEVVLISCVMAFRLFYRRARSRRRRYRGRNPSGSSFTSA